MGAWERVALWIIATGVLAAGLFFLREALTQFALALMLWLIIDGVAAALHRRFPAVPKAAALVLSLIATLSLASLSVYVVARNIGAMAANSEGYETRLDEVVEEGYRALGLRGDAAPTVSDLIARTDPSLLVQEIGASLQTLVSNTIFIFIFLGFLFSAAQMMPKKLDRIFRRADGRAKARQVITSIRLSMERYLWVQTAVSFIITVLTYITLLIIGLDNALFWAFLIFFLNYIPTVGSIVATVLPTAFALVQFPSLGPVIAVAAGVGFWQFIVGNFLQPRMTGESLNLSAVVVLLALAIWGTIWGIPGAFLAAPLTVMIMIVLAQFPSTRWIAILLSADGKPIPDEKPVHKSEAE